MPISDQLHITGQKVALAGFRAHQNMGDELILLGNIRLLQQQNKTISIIAHDPQRLREFLSQSLDTTEITFLQELPRGIRSIVKYFRTHTYPQIKNFFQIDTIILGGGEIFTEESPHAYYYRLRSIRPALLFEKNLYLMGGIQVPTKRINKVLFRRILRHTKQIFARDKEEIPAVQTFGFPRVSFFMDTSYFAVDNRKKFKHTSAQKYIIININSKGLQFLPDICKEIIHYAKLGYTSTYVAVCQGPSDDDTEHFASIQEMLPNMYKQNLQIRDRSKDFTEFLHYIGGAEKVISTRLHLFLISEFMGLETHVFPYQKKINKMKSIIEEYKQEL